MNRYIAIFDLDETIINCKSLFEVYKTHCLSENGPLMGQRKFDIMIQDIKSYQANNMPRDELNKLFYGYFSGISRHAMLQSIKNWFLDNCKKDNFFNQLVLEALRQHQRNGARVIILSGSFSDCVSVIAEYLNVTDFLSINLACVNDIYTGKMMGIQTIGEGKLLAILNYIQKLNLKMEGSYGYGDHISDLPFLNAVENPVAVGNNVDLMAIAHANNWRSINF
ncbi:MAG: HAD-IB family hydrolase [Gammaproteobacteria bacterium]|nr:HAD-IB family hydrolase [Gammaproteobacteria bacterium]